jgi:hypothetical protein
VQTRGPLKITVRSSSLDQQWRTIWEFFPTYARMTVQLAPVAYYFNYEGTPGGSLQPASDLIVRSTGESALASEAWAADITGEEWMFAADPALGRSLYLVHYNDADTTTDSYKPDGSKMTVLAFGRNGSSRFLTQVPSQFAFGLVDSTTVEGVQPAIHNVYKPLTYEMGAAEKRPFDPSPTPTNTNTPSPTPTDTATPTPTGTPTQTATASPTSTPSPTATASPTATSTATPTNVSTASPTATATPTLAQSLTPTATGTLLATGTATATATFGPSPTTTTTSPTPSPSPTVPVQPMEGSIYLPVVLDIK